MKTNGDKKIWPNIARYLELRGESIATLADKSGVTRQAIYLIKKRGTANSSTLSKIAKALETDISILVS
jgi:transcriptional regulator with XRE-family HTH domain